MSMRSTMDLGLATLMAPSESGSAVGVMAAVGAAVAGLAVLGAALVDIASWPHVSVPRVVTRSAASLGGLYRGPKEVRERVDLSVWLDRLLHRRDATPDEAPWTRRGLVPPGRSSVLWAKWIRNDPDTLRVLADKLIDDGDQAGEVLAYEIDSVPYVNVLPPSRVDDAALGCWFEHNWQFRHLPNPGDVYEWPRILAEELGANGVELVRDYNGQEFRNLVPDYEGSYRYVPCLSAYYPSSDSVDVTLYKEGA